MRDEAMNPDEALHPEEAFQNALDARLTLALETRPAVAAPEGFAARVASLAPARRPVRLRCVLPPTHYGQTAMVLCVWILAAAMLVLAAYNIGHTAIGLTVEWLLCAQFVLLATWLGVRRRDLR
jgi:hypothetical protein